MPAEFNKLDDYLTDASFREWVRQGGLRQTAAFWSRYWQDHPDRQPLMRQAQNILLAAHLPHETIPAEQTERFVDQTLQHIQPVSQKRWLRWQAWPMAAAALLILLAGLGWWGGQPETGSGMPGHSERSPAGTDESVQTQQNSTGSPQLITLADGSTVLLHPQATLRFPARFAGQNREVSLTGEAFFRVVKRPEQPFLVLANGMVTKVLGTSFRVRANETDPTVTVEVKTGRVAVFAQADLDRVRQSPGLSARSVLVTPNQQVVYERKTGQMNRSLVDEPALLVIPSQNRDFVFTDTPINQVFATLETAYGVDIVYDADALQRCTLTAPLGNEPLFDKLTVICRAIGGRYEVVGAQVVVQAEGCAE